MLTKILQMKSARFVLVFILVLEALGSQPTTPVAAATLMVTNTNDSGPGSLRQAIVDVGTDDVITFDPSLAGATITLASDIVVTFDGVTVKRFTIDGSGLSPQVTISGANKAHMEFSSDTDVTISSLTITHGYPGGIISSGNLTIINSTLKSNISHQSGGAIRNSGTLILKNSTITQNRADTGGGIAIEGNQNSQIINTTIIGNLATNGGGISIVGNAFVNTYNTTFAGNFADHGAEVMAPMASSYLGATNTIFVCAQENTDCYQYAGNIGLTNSILGVDTLYAYGLMALVDNGGPTQTMALLPGSPLIDAGNDASCMATDQRGVIRPKGSHCDIGAYEYYETQAIVRYVKPGALGLNNGTSWANAYTDLQTALSATFPDEEIWVAAGTYKPTTTTDRSVSFNLHNGVALYGGFAGGETSLAQRDPAAHPTILSGDIGAVGSITSSDNSYHVVVGSGTNNSAILDGFIVRGGNANESFSNYQGGGMYIYLGEPLIANTTFEANSAYYGGGVFIGGDSDSPEIMSHPILKNLIFKNNSADYGGGGLSTENYIHAVLTEVVFDGNTAGFSGGGSRDNIGHISFSNVVFKNNTADSGGGTLNQESKISMTNVTFSGNLAVRGGGMKNNAVDSTLINVTFYGNSAEEGGGIWNTESKPVLTNVTFYNNSASTFGGAIFSEVDYGQTDSQTTMRNAILWGNTALTGPQIYNGDGSVATVSDSVVEGGFPGGTNIITTDPLLGILGNNGGFTETIPLQAGSSAVDTGNDANCPATDQRGVKRPQGTQYDIGAYEYQDLTPPSVLSIVRTDANPTSSNMINFTVSFSENVVYVGTNDFAVAPTGVTGASITNVTGSGTSYIVSVNTGTGNGKIHLDVPVSATVQDQDGNPLDGVPFTSSQSYTVLKTPTFTDVSMTHPYYQDIEILYANGLTAGCSTTLPLRFCPDQTMNRGEAAVFMLRGNLGSSFAPDAATHIFKDDWTKGTWAEPWSEAMYKKGMSAGCLSSPLKYCPWEQIPREQAVIFALRLKYGMNYVPPAATGTLFADMTNPSYFATSWAEQAYKDGLIASCGTSGGKPLFCPKNLVSRGLAAQMIVRAKNLTMP